MCHRIIVYTRGKRVCPCDVFSIQEPAYPEWRINNMHYNTESIKDRVSLRKHGMKLTDFIQKYGTQPLPKKPLSYTIQGMRSNYDSK
jgi:hypothetical protein